MQTQELKLGGVTNGTADNVTRVLSEVSGVNDVSISPGIDTATVQFDQNRTSVQELQAVLTRAGYAPAAKTKQSGCCGGCGG